MSGASRNVSVLTKLNPTTGASIAGPTPLSSNAQTFLNVDLAACSLNPTLSLQENIVGRYAPGDQFGLKITGGGITGGNTATTTGSATGVQPRPGHRRSGDRPVWYDLHAKTTLSLGETLHYSYLVTNTGGVTLAPVTITETAFTGSGTPPVVSCPASVPSLAAGASSLARPVRPRSRPVRP